MHDAYIGGRSENNIKFVVHDDLGRKNRTARYNWRAPWKKRICSTTVKLRKSLVILTRHYHISYMLMILTGADANSELQRIHGRAAGQSSILQAHSAIQFWLDRESSYHRLSQLALDLVASPVSQAYIERLLSSCGDLTDRKRNRTRNFLYIHRRVFLKLNRYILHWTQCTVNWSVTCFWYCRTTEDYVAENFVFDFYWLT